MTTSYEEAKQMRSGINVQGKIVEEHFMLGLTFKNMDDLFGRSAKALDDGEKDNIWSVVTASWSQEEYAEWEEFHNILHRVWEWRAYQVCRLAFTEETTDRWYPEAPHEVNFKDVKKLGFDKKTFATGMYVLWFLSGPVKQADESIDGFRDRVDTHHYEFGYVCKEAIDIPMFHRGGIFEELKRHRLTIQNLIGLAVRSRSR